MNILVIDNYDSFTYNLVQMLQSFDDIELSVRRNDQFELFEVEQFEKIVLSPGPGIPSEAGLMPQVVREFGPRKSILGVCLGHQCIGEVYGAALFNITPPLHGKATRITVTVPDEELFKGLPQSLSVGRYHSWVVHNEGLPEELEVTALDSAGQIMALRHKQFDVRGVQFHPESILTPNGCEMLRNWVYA
jgi:anthranilate synthase component 2